MLGVPSKNWLVGQKDEEKQRAALFLFPDKRSDKGCTWDSPNSGVPYSLCYDLEKALNRLLKLGPNSWVLTIRKKLIM